MKKNKHRHFEISAVSLVSHGKNMQLRDSLYRK